jgi:hypothetical protein
MTAEAAPQISIHDLQNVLKIIDAAAERGAFKGNELTAVGTVRDKVANFLAAIPGNEPTSETEEVEQPAEETKASTTRRKSKA